MEEKMKKITKRDRYTEILNYVADDEELTKFVEHEIELIDNRAEAEKVRRAKKAKEVDALSEAILNQIPEDFITVDELTEAVRTIEGYEDVTRNKITSRVGKFVEARKVMKGMIKQEDGRTIVAYKVFPQPDAEATDEE